jgi:hypothetical protein
MSEGDEEVFGETEASLDAARDELTATVAATLRQQCAAYDPSLSLLLRYLVGALPLCEPAQMRSSCCCQPGTAVTLLWPAVNPALAGENLAI